MWSWFWLVSYFIITIGWNFQFCSCLNISTTFTSNPNSSSSVRINGGRPAQQNEFPYKAALYFRSTFDSNVYILQCGGSIYNTLYILTASNCLRNQFTGSKYIPDEIRIVIGETIVRNTILSNDPNLLQVSSFVEHEKYTGRPNPIFVEYNIALIRLTYPIVYSRSVRNIRIARSYEQPGGNNNNAQLPGYGITLSITPSSTNFESTADIYRPLRVASLRIVSRQVCSIRYLQSLPDSLLCARTFATTFSNPVSAAVAETACFDDSGSPLICFSSNGPYQCGIVGSVVLNICGIPGVPGIFTNLGSFYDWIVARAGRQ